MLKNPMTRLSAQPGQLVLRFSCVPNQSPQETCLEGENFCEKHESMFASLVVYFCKPPPSSSRSVHANPGRGSATGRTRSARRQACFRSASAEIPAQNSRVDRAFRARHP
ncbi:hypothetical protein EMIT0P74_40380 [Pseudomonas sp. IT-P74]